jgi:hypothetical protein
MTLRSPSPRPSPLGRGRGLCRAGARLKRLGMLTGLWPSTPGAATATEARAASQKADGSSLSPRERVRVRRKGTVAARSAVSCHALFKTTVATCLLALLLTGCIWTRLLALKNQFADFDRFVKVDDQEGLSLHLLKPVLYSSDVRSLMEADPTTRSTNGAEQTWDWTFEKLPGTNAEAGGWGLGFSTSFQKDKLSRLTIPDRFRAIVDKETVLAMARSLGRGKVDEKKRQLSSRLDEGGAGPEFRPLSRAQVIELLGLPCRVSETGQETVCCYDYRLKSATPHPGKPKLAQVQCLFTKATDRLKALDVSYGQMRIRLDFAGAAGGAK